MRTMYYVKTTLKGMFANGIITIAYFVLLPVILAGVMGFMQGSTHDNPLKLKKVTVSIVDEDKTKMSQSLIEFLKSEDIQELVAISNEDSNCDLIIKEGYEKNLISLNKGNIVIKKNNNERNTAIETLKVILDKYHKGMYVGLSGGSQEELEKLNDNKAVESTIIDVEENISSYRMMSSSMIGFVVTMLIYGLIEGSYSKQSVNLSNKIRSTPTSRLGLLISDLATNFIYCFIIMSVYVLFFRFTRVNFTGNIFSLTLILGVSSLFMSTISIMVLSLFGPKYGKIVGVIMFLIPVASMEMFSGVESILSSFSVTHLIIKVVNWFTLYGTLKGVYSSILILFGLSVIFFIISMIKEIMVKEVRRCV
ncbi:ABC-2 family transporter protein [Clostridium paraputrificum]|uniref:ABC-2 family transporter protein n=1 Tax=Clostridium paraputrificum TaxID=29363 RepID=A0A6N2YDN0_9CLOT|nr:ABC transporter permease [Clostridium sp.]MBS5986960.1 ABC transporter permease [Clostridium sp.]